MENRQQKSTSPKGTDGIKIMFDDLKSHINDSTTRISTSTNDSQNYNIIIPQTSDIAKFEELYNNNNKKNTD
jgi:hypothetical protein